MYLTSLFRARVGVKILRKFQSILSYEIDHFIESDAKRCCYVLNVLILYFYLIEFNSNKIAC